MRIKTSVTSNPVQGIQRSDGTKTAAHISGSVVRRVLVEPIELEDHLLSEHLVILLNILVLVLVTIAALPEKQSKQPTTKEHLSHHSTVLVVSQYSLE